jgi:hypothetical protein
MATTEAGGGMNVDQVEGAFKSGELTRRNAISELKLAGVPFVIAMALVNSWAKETQTNGDH